MDAFQMAVTSHEAKHCLFVYSERGVQYRSAGKLPKAILCSYCIEWSPLQIWDKSIR